MDNTIGKGTGENATFTPLEELGYEQARAELVEIVGILERGDMSLDESLRFWERGEALVARCEEHLSGASARIEKALGSAEDDDA